VVAHSIIPASWEVEVGGSWSNAGKDGQKLKIPSKKTTKNGLGGVAQVVEGLFSKHKSLSSNTRSSPEKEDHSDTHCNMDNKPLGHSVMSKNHERKNTI
jgi:hypothetical protein